MGTDNYDKILKLKSKQQFQAPLNILLADDDTDDCLIFEQALKEIPIDTHFAVVRDGEQLMEYLSVNALKCPDILFLDLSMPRKTGLECLSEIRENATFKTLHIIMLSTSYPRDTNYEQGLIKSIQLLGADKFIRKPRNFNEIKSILNEALLEAKERIMKVNQNHNL